MLKWCQIKIDLSTKNCHTLAFGTDSLSGQHAEWQYYCVPCKLNVGPSGNQSPTLSTIIFTILQVLQESWETLLQWEASTASILSSFSSNSHYGPLMYHFCFLSGQGIQREPSSPPIISLCWKLKTGSTKIKVLDVWWLAATPMVNKAQFFTDKSHHLQ
jgi:hypothetical protein